MTPLKLTNSNNLKQILTTLKDLSEANPDDIFRQNARIRLLNKIGASQAVASGRYTGIFIAPYRFALASFLVFLVGGAGTVLAAAQFSLPSDALYPVKTASEQVLLAALPPPLKGSAALMIADRRVNEVAKLSNENKQGQIPNAISKYEQSIEQAKTIDHLSQKALSQHEALHQQILIQVLQQSSDQAKSAVERAINTSAGNQQDQPQGKNENINLLPQNRHSLPMGSGQH